MRRSILHPHEEDREARRRSREAWRNLVAEWRSSGAKAPEFARLHGLKAAKSVLLVERAGREEAKPSARLVPVHVAPREVRSIGTELASVERYFREALPLHVQDEEQSILPRLAGMTEGLDGYLSTMRREHHEHEPKLGELLAACAALRGAPRDVRKRALLASIAEELATDFERHLMLEEQHLFPALARLAPSLQGAIIAEMRERRAPGAPP